MPETVTEKFMPIIPQSNQAYPCMAAPDRFPVVLRVKSKPMATRPVGSPACFHLLSLDSPSCPQYSSSTDRSSGVEQDASWLKSFHFLSPLSGLLFLCLEGNFLVWLSQLPSDSLILSSSVTSSEMLSLTFLTKLELFSSITICVFSL